MTVAVHHREAVRQPDLEVQSEHILAMLLRTGSIEAGARRSSVRRMTLEAGEMRLCTRHSELWIGSSDLHFLSITFSDAALTAACRAERGDVELRKAVDLVADTRVSALVAALNAERVAGFPGGRLFLDSVEQALALALVNGYAVRRPSSRIYRGGLTPANVRRVTEFVDAKIDADVTLEEMAESVGLSVSHFSQMFRKATGQTPHQFVLRHRVDCAKEILRNGDLRVVDVAVACGFKTQQHFARVFRKVCGLNPTEYRHELLR